MSATEFYAKAKTDIKSGLSLWKLAIFKGVNGWSLAVLMAFMGYTDGDEYKTPFMHGVRLIVFCWVAGSKFLDGYLDQTIQNTKKDIADSQPKDT
jgi:hypothetical protein